TAWLREHPGRTRVEYNRLLRDDDSEVWEWRQAKGRAINEVERQAWERDLPGEGFPKHEGGPSDPEDPDPARWRRQRERPGPRRSARARTGAGRPRHRHLTQQCRGAVEPARLSARDRRAASSSGVYS